MMHPFVVSDGIEEVWYQNIVNNKNNRSIFFAVENRTSNEMIGFSALVNKNYVH